MNPRVKLGWNSYFRYVAPPYVTPKDIWHGSVYILWEFSSDRILNLGAATLTLSPRRLTVTYSIYKLLSCMLVSSFFLMKTVSFERNQTLHTKVWQGIAYYFWLSGFLYRLRMVVPISYWAPSFHVHWLQFTDCHWLNLGRMLFSIYSLYNRVG